MGIQKDAGEILIYFYKEYIKTSRLPNMRQGFIEKSGWDIHRIRRAISYLNGKDFIEAKQMVDGRYIIIGIEPDGIDVVENQKEFKKNFNFTVNLGLVKYSWGAQEK